MPLRFPIVLVLSFVCLPTPSWANFETGMDGYQRGHYATALREWRPLTEQGDASAQCYLGVLYEKGRG
jgi:TPR repeat protein